MNLPGRPPQWDIFCRVIDNFGDIGICWRLSVDLAGRGQTVRLWVDDASALDWMAPAGHPGVQVLPWTAEANASIAAMQQHPPGVLVEAFGCEIPVAVLSALASERRPPVWLNLEYLSAEAFAARSHGLPSPVQTGPAAGWTKWFFYPGFTPDTGGLLRETGLSGRQAAFDRNAWLQQAGIDWQGEALVSLFCYEPPALAGLLRQLRDAGLEGRPVRLVVCAGRAARAVQAALEEEKALKPSPDAHSMLSISYLSLLPQADFDHLLWACDLNFVRGEDSIVRAIWAGKPFVWQIYPQDDGAHHAKLEAFLDAVHAPPSWRAYHHLWNAEPSAPGDGGLPAEAMAGWAQAAVAARQSLNAQDDLTTRLLQFVQKSR